MTATFYKPSGRISILGVLATAIVSGVITVVLAFLYAGALVYNPSAYLGLALPILYGAAIGAITSLLGKRFKVRNTFVLVGLAVILTMGGYLLSWIPWVWLTLSHLGSPIDIEAVLYPPSFVDILGLIYENGAWTIGSSGSGGAVSGMMLGLVWLLEVAMVFGAGAFTAFAVGSSGVFCETCEEWCTKTKELFRHATDASAQLIHQLESNDLTVLTAAPRADPAAAEWVETELAHCRCGATNTLLVERCTRTVDNRGNASVTRNPLVTHLLISKDQLEWVRRAAGR